MKKLKPLYLYFKDSLTPCKTIFDNMHQQFWCKQLQEQTGYPDDESVAPLNLWAITFIRTVTLQVAWQEFDSDILPTCCNQHQSVCANDCNSSGASLFAMVDSTVSKLVVFWLYFYIKANLQSTCVNLPSNLPRMQAVNLSFCASRWKTQTECV